MSKLYPEQGEQPTKIALVGAEQGSPAAKAMLAEYGAAIKHFHAAARQQRTIQGSTSGHAHGRLPNGGTMRYSWNNGQEVLTLNVQPQEPPPRPEPTFPQRPPVVTPTLAIDVLFENEPYLTGDVYSSNAPEGYNDPAYWTAERMLAKTDIFYSAARVVAYYRTNAIFRRPMCTPLAYGFWQGIVPFAEGNPYSGPYYPYLAQPYGPLIPAPPIVFDNGVAVWTYYMTARIEFDILEEQGGVWVERHVSFVEDIIIGKSIAEQVSGNRETYEYLDALVPVGIIGNAAAPDPAQQYGALSLLPPDRETGEMVGDPKRRDDDRLRALGENFTKEADDRELLFTDPKHMGFVGSGFTAVPVLDPSIGGSDGQKCVFDIYIATENLNKHNEEPGNADSGGWYEDSPDMEYEVGDVRDGPTEIGWKIRAREFSDSTPVAVKVQTWTERRMRVWATSPPGTGETGEGPTLVVTPGGIPNPDNGWYVNEERIAGGIPEAPPPPPTPPGEPTPPPPPQEPPGEDDRAVTWYFAADKDWEDKGAEPADPENMKPAEGDKPPKRLMGELLAELAGSSTPEGPPEDEIEENREHEVRQQSIWDKDVKGDPDTPEQEVAKAIKDKMTKIATVTWYPPSKPGLKGKAEIVAA